MHVSSNSHAKQGTLNRNNFRVIQSSSTRPSVPFLPHKLAYFFPLEDSSFSWWKLHSTSGINQFISTLNNQLQWKQKWGRTSSYANKEKGSPNNYLSPTPCLYLTSTYCTTYNGFAYYKSDLSTHQPTYYGTTLSTNLPYNQPITLPSMKQSTNYSSCQPTHHPLWHNPINWPTLQPTHHPTHYRAHNIPP